MMSMNELYDQIDTYYETIQDSKVTDEGGLMTPMAPLEVLVRHSVLWEVARWIEDDFVACFYHGPIAVQEALEAAGFEASYDERDIAHFAEEVWHDLWWLGDDWARSGDLSDTTLERRGLGETREQVWKLTKAFLEELM
jgi:hypothetical protein